MFKIQNLFFALLLSNVNASSFLRPAETSKHRDLSEEFFFSYEPITVVTDHAAIDLDQKLIEELLLQGTDQGKQQAKAIYTQGAHSKSYAELTLSQPLQADLGKGVTVVGQTASGNEVRGTTMNSVKTGDNVLEVQYHVSPIQSAYVKCQVGANPEPMTDGCFENTGTLEIDGLGNVEYEYNMLESNFNGRTLQGFSTEAQEKMYECTSCPYGTYLKFYKYYGEFDYANQWVMAAFENRSTATFGLGSADFSLYGQEGLAEVIKKGTAYMNVWMYVVREMEDAIDDCENDCATDECNDDQVHAWDEAVAFYTGSVPKSTPSGGHLLYTLAQKRCADFGTCLSTTDESGMAFVNSEIFKNFRIGKQNLVMGNCEIVNKNVEAITQLMAVPLVQGTIRYAFIMDVQNDKREKAQAEGAVFAAAVLPLVHACSEDDAKLIYDNMKVGNGGHADFEVVKGAFERNYQCLGITCDHVGGIVDDGNGGFMEGAEPCGHIKHTTSIATSPPNGVTMTTSTASEGSDGVTMTTSTATEGSDSDSGVSMTTSTATAKKDDGPNVGLAVGLTIGIVAGLIIIALIISRKSNQKEYEGTAEPEMA